MKKITVLKEVTCKVFLKCVLMLIAVGITVFLGIVWQDASKNACKVSEILQAWEDKGLPGTAAWRVRELLAHLWWLGPLRLSPPQDPLEACGVPEGVSWWDLLLRTHETRRLLVCLQEEVA